MKATKKIPYIVDTTLTPANAAEKGYVFVKEVFNPYQALLELLDLAQSNGYQFGALNEEENINQVFGLYKKR